MATYPVTLTTAAGKKLRCLSARLVHFYLGAWVADVVLDLDAITDAPSSGGATLFLGGVNLSGTVDPRNSGTFGPAARVRLVAGAGAWDQVVPSQDFHVDGGVLSTNVYQQTASLIGETVVDASPVQLGIDFVRSSGPASRIFRDKPWWVDVTGVTNVGPRPASSPDASLLVRDFDPSRGRITFSCDTLLLPNTAMTDARFNGASVVVYDVEQLFDAQGSQGWAWVGQTPATQLIGNFKAATLEWTRANYLRVIRYRLIQYQGPGPGGGPPRLALQAVTPSAGLPDIVPLFPFSGLAGAVNTLAPSQEVLVVFENADPTLPRIVGYSLDGLPLKTTIDASVEVDIGPSAPVVALAGGVTPLVLATWATGLAAALTTFATAAASATTAAQIATAAGALETALGALPAPATVKTKAA